MREFTDAHERGENPDPPPFFMPGEMHDSGAVFVECPNGHKSAVIYNHHKYEVLFQSGTAALEDGYANEAVSTMAAALERSYELFVRVISRKRGMPVEQIDATWKLLSRQSERQFGAFCAFWLLECTQAFPLPPKIPEFRNKVIHRGYIPALKEVREFAEEVYKLIKLIVGHLQAHADQELTTELMHEAGVQIRAIPKGMPRVSMSQAGINDVALATFDDWLKKFREMRAMQESLREHTTQGA